MTTVAALRVGFVSSDVLMATATTIAISQRTHLMRDVATPTFLMLRFGVQTGQLLAGVASLTSRRSALTVQCLPMAVGACLVTRVGTGRLRAMAVQAEGCRLDLRLNVMRGMAVNACRLERVHVLLVPMKGMARLTRIKRVHFDVMRLMAIETLDGSLTDWMIYMNALMAFNAEIAIVFPNSVGDVARSACNMLS